jgi:hypothetical protein
MIEKVTQKKTQRQEMSTDSGTSSTVSTSPMPLPHVQPQSTPHRKACKECRRLRLGCDRFCICLHAKHVFMSLSFDDLGRSLVTIASDGDVLLFALMVAVLYVNTDV